MKIDKQKHALIVVDVQNDFCPGGSLAVPDGNKLVPVINSLIPKFFLVYTTQDWHPANHISFKAEGGIWPPHCVQNSEGANFHPGLKIEKAKHILKGTDARKEAYSGFQGTDLALQLRRDGIERIMVCGLATDYCVKNSVLDGLRHGFEVTVVEDAIRGVELKPGDSAAAIDEMRKAGAEFVRLSDLA